MKTLLTLLTCLFILSPNVVMSETVKYEDLVKREGLYYKKFSDVPFTGKTTGKVQGTFKNGKKDGPWFDYHKNGKLLSKGTYKDGKREGPWVDFHSDGTKRMSEKKTGTIIFDEGSGFYRNGKKVSD